MLEGVRRVALGGYEHQELPFEKLVEELQPERDLSRNPLFQTVMVLQNAPEANLNLPGLKFSILDRKNETAKFDLTLEVQESGRSLLGLMQYRTDLFEESTISRMAQHFRVLLEGIVTNPSMQVSSLPLLTPQERQQQLDEWNSTETQHSTASSLSELFEQQVTRRPDAIALSSEDQQLTYRQLNERANQLAHHLLASGVTPESVVAVCLPRSLEMVVALLAVFKAGGAYLPLDPQYPHERLSFMLKDADASLLLTTTSLRDSFSAPLADAPLQVTYLDSQQAELASFSTANPPPMAGAWNLAYVIYTSGSTGTPKGVMVSHHNVTSLLLSTQRFFKFHHQDVWSLFHSYAFDFSVWEIWGALCSGARLVIVPFWVSRSPQDFYRLLADEAVTILNQTPSAFRHLAAVAQAEHAGRPLPALRLVIFGGEALEPESLRGWFDCYGDERPELVNMYGITETTVHVTYQRITRAEVDERRGSLIGQAIQGWRAYLLDGGQQLVPVGVSAELYIGGGGVARGYLGRADLTAERFVPDPFSTEAGARMYRSGDMARRLSDGRMKYEGRQDEQVKVRGYRVELGEIESELLKVEGIEGAVVVARRAEGGEQQLVAYVVTGGAEVEVGRVREELRGRVPEYMIPGVYVRMERLPETASGKVDRRRLPALDEARGERVGGGQQYLAPRSLAEKILCDVWGEVLGLEQVGVHDNFFTLGGDSIRSIQVMSRAKERGLSFSIQKLFQHQTIAQLAGELKVNEEALPATVRTEPFELISAADLAKLPAGLEDAYPLTMLQAGMLYHMHLTPEINVYHNVDSLHLRIPFKMQAFEEAVQMVVARHAVLRTSFDLTSYSEPLQLVHKNVRLPIGLTDLRHLSSEECERVIDELIESERKNRFDLSQPPLLRFHLHRRTDETLQFSFTECHAILDGWSLQSTLTEIFKNYLALLNHRSIELEPEPTTTFRDYVRMEREAIVSEECRNFWSDRLKGCTATEVPRWEISSPGARGTEQLNFDITPQMSDELKKFARDAGVPLKSVVLAAHVKALSVLSGSEDVLTGLTSNGRVEGQGGEQVRGLFLNVVPFRFRAAGQTWRELVEEVFETEREMLPYRRYPMAALQQSLGIEARFETAFNYVHFHVVDALLHDAELEVLTFKKSEMTNYKLLAHFSQSPGSGQLAFTLEYDTAEFGAEQISSIGGHYLSALNVILRTPHAQHNSQSLLSPDERHQQLRPQKTESGMIEPTASTAAIIPAEQWSSPYLPPTTDLERTIGEIWQEALHVEKVGVNDNFFDLGGHSLIMMKVHLKLQEVFKVNIPMVKLFDYPTVRLLAKFLAQEQDEQPSPGQSQQRVEIRKNATKRQRRQRMQNRAARREETSRDE